MTHKLQTRRLRALGGAALALLVGAVAATASVAEAPAAARQAGSPRPNAVRRDSAGGTTAAARTAGARGRAARAGADTAKSDTRTIMREVYAYEGRGRRDPFFSLMATSELRPTIGELSLSVIIYDPTGRRSIVVLRDKKDQTQYRLTTGMQIGRMRIVDIKPKSVIFAIEEFGSTRRDSLVLTDTTKVRR